jgi:hypothetical protein
MPGVWNFAAKSPVHPTAPDAENTAVKILTESESQADWLRSEIVRREARYDGSFPFAVYSFF